jgi:F-type H+-transporting ATPase subunit c
MLLIPTSLVFAVTNTEPAVMNFFSISSAAAILGVALAATGCGIGMSFCITSALQGIARQPEITSKLQMNMMIGLAFIESLVLYTLFIAIILLFANPFTKFVG